MEEHHVIAVIRRRADEVLDVGDFPGGHVLPGEHDAIGWFGNGQLDGLSFADPSYLGLLRRLLLPERH
jgi:hypothetical protein